MASPASLYGSCLFYYKPQLKTWEAGPLSPSPSILSCAACRFLWSLFYCLTSWSSSSEPLLPACIPLAPFSAFIFSRFRVWMDENSSRQALGFLVFLLKTVSPSSPLTGKRWDGLLCLESESIFSVVLLLCIQLAHSALLTATILPTICSWGLGLCCVNSSTPLLLFL